MPKPLDTDLPPGIGEETDASIGVIASAADPAPKALLGRLAGMSLGRQIFVLALWPFLQQLLNWMVSSVDTAVAGHLPSKAATNAIAVAGMVNWFMGMMVMSVGAGGAALIARAVGGGHKRLVNAGVGQTLLMGTLSGILVGAMVFALADPISQAAGLSGESLAMSKIYLRITAGFVPLAAILFVSAHCMTAVGDTRAPFFVMLMMNLVNLVLTIALAMDEISVYGVVLGHGWAMGVTGIALGTVIGWAVGAALMVALLTRRGGYLRLHVHRLSPHPHTLKRIWRVAYPNMLDRGGHWVGNWIVIMIVGIIGAKFYKTGGDDLLGAHIIAIRIESISFLPAMAFATAAGTLTGQYLGANDPAMARQAAKRCWFIGAGLMFILGLFFIAIPEQLVVQFTDKPEFLTLAPPLVRICGFVQFFFGSALVLQGAMRGAGDTRVPAILSNSLTWGLRLPLAALLGLYFGLGLTGVWYALCGELLVRGIVFIIRYMQGGWLKVKV